MSTPEMQEALLWALGPHDITLVHEPRLPAQSMFAAPGLNGKLLCSVGPLTRLSIAFARIEMLVRWIGGVR